MAGPERSADWALEQLKNVLRGFTSETPAATDVGARAADLATVLSAEASEVKDVAAMMAQVSDLKKRVLAQDHRKSLDWQQEFLARASDPAQAKADLAWLAEANNQAIQDADDALLGLQKASDAIAQHQHVPALLKAEQGQWAKALDIVAEIDESAESRERVAGWVGRAAEDYTQMAKVQSEACHEWLGLTKVMVEAYGLGIRVNTSMVAATHSILSQVIRLHRLDGQSPERAEYYMSTRRLTQLMNAACTEIAQMSARLSQTLELVSADLEAVHNALVILSGGRWPHGRALAGQPAGNIPDLREHDPQPASALPKPTARGNFRPARGR